MLDRGYEIAPGLLSITFKDGSRNGTFVAITLDKKKGTSVAELARMMTN